MATNKLSFVIKHPLTKDEIEWLEQEIDEDTIIDAGEMLDNMRLFFDENGVFKINNTYKTNAWSDDFEVEVWSSNSREKFNKLQELICTYWHITMCDIGFLQSPFNATDEFRATSGMLSLNFSILEKLVNYMQYAESIVFSKEVNMKTLEMYLVDAQYNCGYEKDMLTAKYKYRLATDDEWEVILDKEYAEHPEWAEQDI